MKFLQKFGSGGGRDTRFLREEINDMEHQISLLNRDIKEKDRQLIEERDNGDRVSYCLVL